MLLSEINPHPRDKKIVFKEEGHEYTIAQTSRKPISVTTLIHKYFPTFNPDQVIDKMMKSYKWPDSPYFGQTPDEIKAKWVKSSAEASSAGTAMHLSIELFLNNQPVNNNTYEYILFQRFWSDLGKSYPTLKPFRTEWLVYDEDILLAGSIDCVLVDDKDQLYILDWKRSKEIRTNNKYEKGFAPFDNFDNCNYSHYCLQLNIYRHLLQTKYNKKVVFLMLVVLHPSQENYMCYPVTPIDLSSVWNVLTSAWSKSIEAAKMTSHSESETLSLEV